jgi:hypothetical protein
VPSTASSGSFSAWRSSKCSATAAFVQHRDRRILRRGRGAIQRAVHWRRALAGTFESGLLERKDERGRSLREAIRDFGLDPNRIPDAQAPANSICYLEFHIEQGPVLENLNLPWPSSMASPGRLVSMWCLPGRRATPGRLP